MKNTINNILKHHTQTDKNNNSGIYQMKCLDCLLKYTGQTGRTFNPRYEEHIQAIRSNCSKSSYLKHILNMGHIWHNNRYYGCHKDRKEEQTFKHLREVSYVQN
jgi:hypothetical protein